MLLMGDPPWGNLWGISHYITLFYGFSDVFGYSSLGSKIGAGIDTECA